MKKKSIQICLISAILMLILVAVFPQKGMAQIILPYAVFAGMTGFSIYALIKMKSGRQKSVLIVGLIFNVLMLILMLMLPEKYIRIMSTIALGEMIGFCVSGLLKMKKVKHEKSER
jgi:hypothetical protein